jgi:biotin carboxyl carrier protein
MDANRVIRSPLPGTFYRRPSPDADPFVSEGEEVRAGDAIGLIEVMKTFYEVRAEAAGVVDRFLVENGDVVSAGQDLASFR